LKDEWAKEQLYIRSKNVIETKHQRKRNFMLLNKLGDSSSNTQFFPACTKHQRKRNFIRRHLRWLWSLAKRPSALLWRRKSLIIGCMSWMFTYFKSNLASLHEINDCEMPFFPFFVYQGQVGEIASIWLDLSCHPSS
jgi:hypothetical protein